MPERNLPVCANSVLSYTSTSETGILVWQGDRTVTYSTSSDLTTVSTIGPFSVKLIAVNGSSLISTATSPQTNSSHQDLRLIVYDNNIFLAKDVTVAGRIFVFPM